MLNIGFGTAWAGSSAWYADDLSGRRTSGLQTINGMVKIPEGRGFKSRPVHQTFHSRQLRTSPITSTTFPIALRNRHALIECRHGSLYPSEVLVATNVRSRNHFARILQTTTEPSPSHLGFGRHNYSVGAARIYFARRSARPTRLRHTSRNRRRDSLRCDPGGPTLLVPTKAQETADADSPSERQGQEVRVKNPADD